ncbi:hypothetical protein JQC72_01325 [Polycladomyces sp. WAk]|uniref:t-SNARE coiled-coil homology domain-containing protein n=1 Tax=Polycladomyces zharkentensis TaxID=2807616 RepID=A0ABS2WFH6_9BACL|nr:hypothetical protein [Polycladomyces sp. WAk]MBN2908165.1 hypothetical protein [Polycladomyces sp. WAk]
MGNLRERSSRRHERDTDFARNTGRLFQLDEGTDRLSNGLTRITDGQIQLAHGLEEGMDKARNQLRGVTPKGKRDRLPPDIV